MCLISRLRELRAPSGALISRRSRRLFSELGRRRDRTVRAAEVNAGTRWPAGEAPQLESPPARFGGRGCGRSFEAALRSVIGSRVQCPALGRGLEELRARSPPASPQLSEFADSRLRRPHSRPALGRPAKSWGPQRWCKVNFSYIPEQADELSLQVGEIVEVIKVRDYGMVCGEMMDGARSG